jgi:hypothetical protein
MKKVTKLNVMMAALLAMAVTVTSCGKDEEPAPVVENGKVMIVHASPDAPAVDAEVDDAKVNGTTPLNFKAASAYLTVKAGSRKFDVNGAGTTTAVISKSYTIEKDKNYTLWAVNKVASLELVLTNDDLTAPATGKAHVRFVHLCPDAPAVDVRVKGSAVTSNVFGNVAFKGLQGFTPLAAGTYDLEVFAAGTTTKVLDLPGVALTAGKIYTVYARGLLASLDAGIIANN